MAKNHVQNELSECVSCFCGTKFSFSTFIYNHVLETDLPFKTVFQSIVSVMLSKLILDNFVEIRYKYSESEVMNIYIKT